jgi:predicted house-cleaning noncanonical NTP pyrophosphatase (MazG superfamily)
MPKIYKFQYEKLVRDNIPSLITKDGAVVRKKVLRPAAYVRELKKKLREEGEELVDAKSRAEILSELADLAEIMDNLRAALRIKSAELQAIRAKKRAKNGSFRRRFYVSHIVADDRTDPAWLRYHLKNKKKFPLIK